MLFKFVPTSVALQVLAVGEAAPSLLQFARQTPEARKMAAQKIATR